MLSRTTLHGLTVTLGETFLKQEMNFVPEYTTGDTTGVHTLGAADSSGVCTLHAGETTGDTTGACTLGAGDSSGVCTLCARDTTGVCTLGTGDSSGV